MAKKVIIIDDNEQDALKITKPLSDAGFSVIWEKDSPKAVEKIYDIVPDLIILDILMPKIGGYELCRLLKSDGAAGKIPVLIYTSLEKNIDKFWAYNSGAKAFVQKTSSLEELIKESLRLVGQYPLDEETKSLMAGSKILPHRKVSGAKTVDKRELLENLRTIDIFQADEKMLALDVFRVIYNAFEYDAAAVAFDCEKLYFDCGNCDFKPSAISEILESLQIEKTEVLSKRISKITISTVEDFNSKYEFEYTTEQGSAFFCMYMKNDVTNVQIKLLETIKNEAEHIIRARRFKNKDDGKFANAVRKIYSGADFDLLISRECDWHKRNNVPMCLMLCEIDSLENIKNRFDEEYADTVVAKVSNILVRSLAQGEFIHRNDDNIFVILITDSSYNRMVNTVEYIKTSVEDPFLNDFESDEPIKLNIGAIMFDKSYKNHYDFMDAAYDSLDAARQNNGIFVEGEK